MRTKHVLIVLAFTVITSLSGMASEAWIETPEQSIRTWTPQFVTEAGWQKADASSTDVRGFVRGVPFKGSLLRLHGLQNIRSHQQAVIKLESGTIRGWPVKSFSETDQNYLKSMATKYVKPGKNDEKQDRTVEYKDYKEEDRGKTYEMFESTYWTVWRGMDKEGKGKEAFKPEFMPRALKYMDQTWGFYKDALQIPMPWSDAKRQPFSWKEEPALHKVNVYLTETGLSRHKKGWANGSSAIQIHPAALGEGSSVLPHEAGHVMQLYMGGMQQWSAVGSFWETHANWQAHQFIPSFVGGQKQYFDNMHYDLNWSGHRYNSWLWLQHLYETPRIGPRIPIDVWLENQKNEEGRSIEDPIQTFLRLFKEKGIFPNDPMVGFGDELGNMAARIVTMDYVYQQTYLDARSAAYKKPSPAVPVVKMEAVPDNKGVLRPPEKYIPGQYGINIMEIETPAGTVTVLLEKDTSRECAEGSWRLTLVAVDKDLRPRYSNMTTQDKAVSINVNKGDRIFAAVTAVPAKHIPREFNDTTGLAQSFPYILTVSQGIPKLK